MRLPRAVGAAERARRLGPRRGAGDRLGRRRGREGARAAAGRGRVVPAARPRGRDRGALGRRDGRAGARRAGSRSGSPPSRSRHRRACSSCASSARRRPGFPRRAGRRPADGRSRSYDGVRAPATTLGIVAGRVYAFANQKGGVGKTTTAVNLAACLAEAGERALVVDLDPQANATSGLGMRANGTSSYDLLDGAPLAELAKPTAFPNLFLVPSKPELAGAAVELSQRADGERFLAEALAGAERLRLRPARLPALARPADRERARGGRPRDRAGAGRVLRARGARAADAVDQPDQGAAQPAARGRRRADHDERRPHEARGRRRGARCAATSATSSSTRSCRARCASPRRRATACRSPTTTAARAAPRPTGRWRWSLSNAASRTAPRPRPRLRGPDRRRGRDASSRTCRSSRSTRTRASRGGASTTRRPPGSPTRSARRASSSRSSCARAPRAATS